MKLNQMIISIVLLISCMNALAQADDPSAFPELVMTTIKGAPILRTPMLIKGIAEPNDPTKYNRETYFPTALGVDHSGPLISQGLGLAAPAFYDWDGDGLKDLLIGEFGSGAEFRVDMGHFIRVYLNIGTEMQPEFSGSFDYARPPFEILSNGTPYSIDQDCCIGFAPQFIDINNDGFMDMVSGQYHGEVISFFGSKKGFLPGVPLNQEGNPRDNSDQKHFVRVMQAYWNYSSANFGDFTGDGKPDLIVGGIGGLRISQNIGTITEPQFAHRTLLHDINQEPLKVYEYSPKEKAEFEKDKYAIPGLSPPYVAGDYQTSPVVVDWDEDGVLDLLVTNHYNHEGLASVDFFRGRKVNNEHRFEPKVPLFTGKDGVKAFPGTELFVYVADWNNDGVKDILIGTSVVIIQNKFSGYFSWNWEKKLGLHGAGRDPGMVANRNPSSPVQWLLDGVTLPQGMSAEDFMTMRHQGYVYVMLGSKEKTLPLKEVKSTKKKKGK